MPATGYQIIRATTLRTGLGACTKSAHRERGCRQLAGRPKSTVARRSAMHHLVELQSAHTFFSVEDAAAGVAP